MDSTSACAEVGWSSHLMKERISPPWSREVWIQSIHGRRFSASTGPVAPSTIIGTRSHQALNRLIMPCSSPTLLCSTQAIGSPVALA